MGSTTTTTYTCDECGASITLDGMADEPAGWFSVYLAHYDGNDKPDGDTAYYCGPVCVLAAAKKMLQEVVES